MKETYRVKGPWSPGEDQQLRNLVHNFGSQNWLLIGKFIPGRSGKSCRLRWCNQLSPLVHHRPFTAEEDQVIFQTQAKIGNKWSTIARLLSGRTDNAVKNHWYATLRRKRSSIDGKPFSQPPPPPPLKRIGTEGAGEGGCGFCFYPTTTPTPTPTSPFGSDSSYYSGKIISSQIISSQILAPTLPSTISHGLSLPGSEDGKKKTAEERLPGEEMLAVVQEMIRDEVKKFMYGLEKKKDFCF